MVELLLITVFLGVIAFFILLKVIGGIIKSFLIFSLLSTVVFVVLSFFVYSDLSSFVSDDKIVLLDFSDNRFDSGFVIRGSSSGATDNSLPSSEVVSLLNFFKEEGDKLFFDSFLDSYDRIIYVNASDSFFEKNISSFLSSVNSFNPERDSVEDLDFDSLSVLGVDKEEIDFGDINLQALRNFDSFDDLSSSLNVPVTFDFDLNTLSSFLSENRVDFYPDSIGFKALDYSPSFFYEFVSGFLLS